MTKVKLADITKEVAKDAFLQAIKKAKPLYSNLSDEDLAKHLGLTDAQFKHFTEKALGNAISEKLEKAFANTLVNNQSIEVPHQFNVFVHTSDKRFNENGTPAKKISVRTRSGLKKDLNQ